MLIALIIFLVLCLLCILYLLSLMGRTRHKDLPRLQNWAYAHRGLHGNGIPENSMRAFRQALQKGYGIEFDVHLMKDGTLAVIHDASLKRTADADVFIEDLTKADLDLYCLEGTWEGIPLFHQVLNLYAGKAPLIIELKSERNNYAQLCQAACDALEHYQGDYCLESFDPRCIRWLRKNRPDIIRGQLAENFLQNRKSTLPFIFKFILTNHLFNFLTRPDFIAYRYGDRNNLSTRLCRKLWRLQGVSWTIRTQEEFDTAVNEGWLPIFESFEP